MDIFNLNQPITFLVDDFEQQHIDWPIKCHCAKAFGNLAAALLEKEAIGEELTISFEDNDMATITRWP